VSDAGQPGPPLLEAGTELAPGYEVRFHVARSRVLDVYDVWSTERDTHCVAKTLRPDRVGDSKPRRRLYREGRILLAMAHPHIVRAYELIAGPQPVLILEPLTGGSLEDALRTGGRVALPTVVELGLQLCSAMHYVHGRRLVHGDLKPANIVGDRGFSKVIDFSLARAPGRGHAGRGTREYLAPEQARGALVSCAADVWGIGAVLYAAAVGSPPFSIVDGAARYPQLERRADRLSDHRRPSPQYALLGDLVAACLEPEARARPSVGELTDRLDEMIAQDDERPPPSSSSG
jgi:serine/threonine protein kinase